MTQFPSDETRSNDFDLPAEPPSWPKVVGIISIVWGSLGLICNGCSLIGGVFQGALMNWAKNMNPQMANNPQFQAPPTTPLALVSHALGLIWSVLLLYAGIQCVKRLAKGRVLHLVWGLGSLVLAVLGGIVGWQQMQVQMQQAMARDPNMARAAGAANTMAYGMFGCIMLFVIIYPVFCLLWFGPMGKRPEAGASLEEPLV